MQRLIFIPTMFLVLLISPWVSAQGNIRTEVEMGGGEAQSKYVEVETQMEQGLPTLLDHIKNSGALLKNNETSQSLVALDMAKQEILRGEKILSDDPQYREIQIQADKIEESLQKAEDLIKANKKSQALQQLTQAYRLGQALSKSPVLKLAATEIALGNASQQIQGKNYRGAGLFLQQAIDNITSIQNDPTVNVGELNKLKNDIVIVQQQVVLGQLQDEKRLKRFYPGLAAARVNALNSYYDVWSRSEMPWDQW